MMKRILQIVLALVIVVLAYLLYESLMGPIRFNKEAESRKSLVVDRLKDIRTLQVAYKGEHGEYTDNFDSLIYFYKSGNIKVIRQFGSFDDSAAVAQGLVFRDTVAIPVKDTLLKKAGFSADSIRFVPLVGGQFEMSITTHVTMSGVEMPLFEACTPNNVWMKGLDRQLIINKNDEQKTLKRYQGLKVGSIDSPNNNAGNWE